MVLQDIWNDMLMRRQGNLTADTNFQRIVTYWANLAAKDIWMGRGLSKSPNWWFLEKTYSFTSVADQMTYDLPIEIDGKKVLSIRDKTNDVKLTYIPQRVIDEKEPDPGSGTPYAYTVYGRDVTTKRPYIRLIDVPDSAIDYFVRFYGNLSSYDYDDPTNSEIEIPDKYDPYLLDGILYRWFEYDPQRGNASEKKAEFYAGIREMLADNKVIDDDMVAESHGALVSGEMTARRLGFSYPVS